MKPTNEAHLRAGARTHAHANTNLHTHTQCDPRRTRELDDGVLEGFIDSKVEANVRHHANDARDPAPPEGNHAFLQRNICGVRCVLNLCDGVTLQILPGLEGEQPKAMVSMVISKTQGRC